MNKVSKLGQFANFVCYSFLQLVAGQLLIIPGTCFCFIYVAFLLLLPRRQEGLTLLFVISFAVGFFIDMFYNSMGVHAFSSVFMVASRVFLLKLMLPVSDYEAVTQPTLSNLGWKRFSLFALVLIGIHHTVVFFLEACSTVLFFVVMRKVVFSTLLTFSVFLLTQSMKLVVRKK